MANFTVRIELHDAEWSDYERLHVGMKQKGFSRLIRANDGRTYRMPWAEYNGNANLTTMEILNIAGEVANGTGKQNAVLVTEAASRAWIGLPVLAGGVG